MVLLFFWYFCLFMWHPGRIECVCAAQATAAGHTGAAVQGQAQRPRLPMSVRCALAFSVWCFFLSQIIPLQKCQRRTCEGKEISASTATPIISVTSNHHLKVMHIHNALFSFFLFAARKFLFFSFVFMPMHVPSTNIYFYVSLASHLCFCFY